MIDFDESESMWKIDGPIGRLSYFWVCITIMLFLVPIIILKAMGLVVVFYRYV
ncbi:hypothetical protein IJ579_03920 [bacterium]|nr:hypothetical protein [bacterium]